MPNIQIERLKALPIRRTGEVWEIAAAPLPAMVPVQKGGRPEQIVVCACVSSEGGAAMADPQTAGGFAPSAPLDALAQFALAPLVPGAKPLNYLPARVIVGPMPEEAERAIVSALTELGVAVEVKADAELTVEFFAGLAEQFSGAGGAGESLLVGAAPLMRAKGMSVERITAFAEAARLFWKAAPWRRFERELVWRIDPVPQMRALRHCTVMGGGGEEFGLAFLADPMQMVEMAAADDASEYLQNADGAHWCVMFNKVGEIPPGDASLWVEHAMPLGAADAYPMPMGVTHSGSIKRPSAANLTLMEGLLRAFVPLTRAEVKAGGFTREVATFDGVRRFTLEAVMGL
ncbi:hypothetical protein PHYC_03462 [Phycisphaerales bacterium]|nr:hypothetical protein PHYC_03462 [Phycisphaerales bacterium]